MTQQRDADRRSATDGWRKIPIIVVAILLLSGIVLMFGLAEESSTRQSNVRTDDSLRSGSSVKK